MHTLFRQDAALCVVPNPGSLAVSSQGLPTAPRVQSLAQEMKTSIVMHTGASSMPSLGKLTFFTVEMYLSLLVYI